MGEMREADRLARLQAKREHLSPETLFDEKEHIERLSRVRQFMFGSLDGLLVPLGVVSGVAGGTSDSKIVVIAGVAEAFAGALSMGAGEYLSSRAEAQVQQAQVADEIEEIEEIPDVERREVELLFEHEGLSAADAGVVAEKITSSRVSWVNTMVEKELGLNAEPVGSAVRDSIAMGVSYLLASIVPLAPYLFLHVHTAFPISVALTVLVLFIIGLAKGRVVNMSMARSALEVVVVGGVSATGGYLLGTLLPHIIGR